MAYKMAALNFQNLDDIMPLCYGKFLDMVVVVTFSNPIISFHADETHYNPTNSRLNLDYSQILTITIISAQFLAQSSIKTSDISDPYVTIFHPWFTM